MYYMLRANDNAYNSALHRFLIIGISISGDGVAKRQQKKKEMSEKGLGLNILHLPSHFQYIIRYCFIPNGF